MGSKESFANYTATLAKHLESVKVLGRSVRSLDNFDHKTDLIVRLATLLCLFVLRSGSEPMKTGIVK